MRHWFRIALAGLALVAPVSMSIAASKSPKLARCDGKQRRPANVHGSILPTVDPAAGTVVPSGAAPRGVDVFPPTDPAKPNPSPLRLRGGEKPELQIPPISAITPPSIYGSC